MSYTEQSLLPKPKKQIWAVAGGKGGTGKTMVSSSLGILLSRMGHKVIIIDADLGGANLHTCFGIRNPEYTLSDFLNKKSTSLSALLTETDFDGLKILSGSNDMLNIANVPHTQKLKLIRHIKNLPADFIIMDLGAGTTFNVLDFFLAADAGVLVALPEPTSIENIYRFLKSAVLRLVKNVLPHLTYNKLIKSASITNDGGFRTIYDFLTHIEEEDVELAKKVNKRIKSFSPKLIVNQARSNEEILLGKSIKDLTSKYLGVSLDYIGYIPYDQGVHDAIKRFTPFLMQTPNCSAAMCLEMAVKKILESNDCQEPLFKDIAK